MLSDPRSEKVKGIARLNQKDARYETGLFLLEGFQGLKELAPHPDLIAEVFATEAAMESRPELFSGLPVEVTLVNDRVMDRISDTKTPQGVVSVVYQLDVDLELVINDKPKLVALMDQVRDPGNAGTILRAADAAGADGIVFSKDSVDLYNPKLVRSTTGSLFHLPTVIEADSGNALADLKAAGLQVYAAAGGGRPITELGEDLQKPTVWIFGNEAHGISKDLLDLSDEVVGLPIYGSAESLNLATAASVCLYQSAFAQNASR
jgi:RNA methyltransferase, TrmH family